MKITGGAKKQKGGYLRGMNTSSLLLENRYVLYLFFIMAIVNLVYYVGINDMKTTAVFIISGFVISYFSKNMIVILCFALVASNIFKYGINPRNIEGFDTDADSEGDDEDEGKVKEGATGESTVDGSGNDVSTSKPKKPAKKDSSSGDSSDDKDAASN